MIYNWHVYSKEFVTGISTRPTTASEHKQLGTSSRLQNTPVTELMWIAETRLDNGARYEIGPFKFRADLDAEIRACEARWNRADSQNYSFKNEDGSASNTPRLIDPEPARAHLIEETRVDAGIGLSGKPSFTSQDEVVVIESPS